jgi:hypothetical protein
MSGIQTVKARMTGIAPSIMHNGQMCDPLNKFAKALKEISGKRKKSDADYEEMARIEFMAGLYVNHDGEPFWPAENLLGMLIAAAKKSKDGPRAKSGINILVEHPLEYKGPKDPVAMFADDNFRSTMAVRVGQARIMRTRPIFRDWAMLVEVAVDTDIVNPQTVMEWLSVAGAQVGLSDFRPRYGRFEVASAA